MTTTKSAIVLPELPYARDALAPHMSRETLDYHYGKHHKAYVDKINELRGRHEVRGCSLEESWRRPAGKLFNNAAQVWNHTFYWHCLTPKAAGATGRTISAAIDKLRRTRRLQEQFDKAAAEQFGSGWAWLVKDAGGALEIVTTVERRDAAARRQDCAAHLRRLGARLLHRLSQRARCLLKEFWKLVNWDFVAQNLTG